jgi:hypothetical protein
MVINRGKLRRLRLMLVDIFYGIIENIEKNCPNQFKLYYNKYFIKYEFNQISSLHG